MSVTPWTSHPTDDTIGDILNVPTYSEKDTENQCLVHCLQMVIDYAAERHPDDWVNKNVDTLSAEEIREKITIRKSGWIPDDKELDQISAEAGGISFNHTIREQSPSKSIFTNIVEEHLSEDLPVIPIINVKKLRRNVKGGAHAVVAVGMNNDSIAINDPWGHPYDVVDRKDFIEAWDDTVNQFITVDTGGQQRLFEGHQNEEGQ